jgi:hypothetical protein
MCAGKGIIHAEMPVHAPGQPDPRGLQLWVDLPKQVEWCSGNVHVPTERRLDTLVQDGGTLFYQRILEVRGNQNLSLGSLLPRAWT